MKEELMSSIFRNCGQVELWAFHPVGVSGRAK